MALNISSTEPKPARQCRHLRAKGMFIDVEPFAAEATMPSMKTGFVWCVHSQNCMGPDGRVAGYDSCVAERDCYEV